MSDEGFGLFDAFEANANSAINHLLERIMTDDNPEEARALLGVLAYKYPADSPHALEALSHYRGMRAALSHDRWFSLEGRCESDRKKRRQQRLLQYRRFLELFEIEVEATRHQKEFMMAASQDWSHMGQHVTGAIRLMRCRCLLRLAAGLYRVGLPGALDLCDSGAFQLFRAAYLQT
jgi:hypothetical protein